MQTETIKTTVLKADEGKILTDGEIYGRTIYLAKGRTADEFYEITEAEYEEIQNQNEPDAEGAVS